MLEKLENNKLLIQREHGQFDKAVFDFRYVNLSEEKKDVLVSVLSELDHKVHQPKSTVTYTIVVKLTEKVDAQLIKSVNKQLNINEEDVGLWVSFTSEYDHSGVRLPKYVLDFYKVVGGQIDFSIIVL